MAKRKSQADTESTQAPAKKTKTTPKKGKKGVDESGKCTLLSFPYFARTRSYPGQSAVVLGGGVRTAP